MRKSELKKITDEELIVEAIKLNGKWMLNVGKGQAINKIVK